MNVVMEKIQAVTSKGQITLPMAWRKKNNAKQILLRIGENSLEISPLSLSAVAPEEYTVFDAIRDSKGKGLKATDLLKLLKKIDE